MSTPATIPGAAAPCPSCGQPMRVGADRCLWCGAAAAAPLAAPAVELGAEPRWGSVATPAPPAAVPPAGPEFTPAPPRQTAPRSDLAGVPRQLLAWLVDVVLTAAVAVGVLVLTGSALLAIVAAAEVAVIQWVAEGRTGATVGGLLTRSRQARADRPWSPGVWRALLARAIRAGGFVLGLGIGVLVVVGSGLVDGSGQRRSWADRVAGTRRVVLLRRAERVPPPPAPLLVAAPTVAVPAMPVADDLELSGGTGAAVVAAAVPVAPMPLASAPSEAPVLEDPGAVAGMIAPDLDLPAGIESTVMTALPAGVSTLLLVFDTGQRESVRTPAAINLGRAPVATEPSDRRIAVHDPESSVSKTHVRIEHSRGQTWVTDMGSTNGTRILGDDGSVRALAPGERRELEEGERVRIGNRSFTVNLVVGALELGAEPQWGSAATPAPTAARPSVPAEGGEE